MTRSAGGYKNRQFIDVKPGEEAEFEAAFAEAKAIIAALRAVLRRIT